MTKDVNKSENHKVSDSQKNMSLNINYKFNDEIVESLNLLKEEDFKKLFVECFCGQKDKFEEEDRKVVSKIIKKLKNHSINYKQFNEILLIFEQDRVGKDFYNFIFEGKDKITRNQIKNGIIKFRGIALLRYGNFRFAYKELINKDEECIKDILKDYLIDPENNNYSNRPSRMRPISGSAIKKTDTWLLGYISADILKADEKRIDDIKGSKKSQTELGYKKSELNKLIEIYDKIKHNRAIAIQKGASNANTYLTWDYMDVYIATSMRNIWEFEDISDFIDKLFIHNKEIEKYHLRYFDPTQSYYEERLNKGLLEGLMLKRASFCIYMAQESDTLGKDSELATTLTQGKPVIVYIPDKSEDLLENDIRKYSLNYFTKRWHELNANNILEQLINTDDPKYIKYREIISRNIDGVEKLLLRLRNHRKKQPFILWKEKEDLFKDKEKASFTTMCKIFAIAEKYTFDNRAKSLKEHHPLAIQVGFENGVANGVLISRDLKKCSELMKSILDKNMQFTIKYLNKDSKIIILEEDITGSVFRVVTDNKQLTNSFWNFYLKKD